MTNKELQDLQTRINFDARSMSDCLGIDYEQYRRYYYGAAKIPAEIERAALELEAINIQFRQTAAERIDSGIGYVPNITVKGEW